MALVPFPGTKHAARAPIDPDEEDADLDGSGAKMSFLEHLDELRKRIIWSLISVGVGFLIAVVFLDRIFDFIMRPLAATLPKGGTMIYTEPTEAFMLPHTGSSGTPAPGAKVRSSKACPDPAG